mmetsp:Transcript_14528/g.31549  ORF Transcript_14528/g.31549 Transcript_14528/m.31549 type:complete len:248 (+) Transcript_14528:1623-2366(+)
MPLTLIEVPFKLICAFVNREIRLMTSEFESSSCCSGEMSMFSLTLEVAIVMMRRIRHCFTKSSGPLILIMLLSLGTCMSTPWNSVSSLAILLPPLPMTLPIASSGTLNLQIAMPSPPFKNCLTSSKAANDLSASPRTWSTFIALRNVAFTSCLASTFCNIESDPPIKSKDTSSAPISISAIKFLARKSFRSSDACSICSFVPLMTSLVSSLFTLKVQPMSAQAFLTSFPGSPSTNPMEAFSIGTYPT